MRYDMERQEWAPVRLRRATLDLLEEFKQRLRNAHEMGRGRIAPKDDGKISNDDAIAELLRRVADHRLRSNRKRGGKGKVSAIANGSDPTASTLDDGWDLTAPEDKAILSFLAGQVQG